MEDKKYVGEVVWFNSKSGYGFLSWKDDGVPQKDMFIHYSDIVSEKGAFKTLKKGQQISFSIGENRRGQPKAVNVIIITN